MEKVINLLIVLFIIAFSKAEAQTDSIKLEIDRIMYSKKAYLPANYNLLRKDIPYSVSYMESYWKVDSLINTQFKTFDVISNMLTKTSKSDTISLNLLLKVAISYCYDSITSREFGLVNSIAYVNRFYEFPANIKKMLCDPRLYIIDNWNLPMILGRQNVRESLFFLKYKWKAPTQELPRYQILFAVCARLGDRESLQKLIKYKTKNDNEIKFYIDCLDFVRTKESVDYIFQNLTNTNRILIGRMSANTSTVDYYSTIASYSLWVLGKIVKDFPVKVTIDDVWDNKVTKEQIKQAQLWRDQHSNYELITDMDSLPL